MQKPKQPIPASRLRIYWAIMLTFNIGMVLLFARQFVQSSAFDNLLSENQVFPKEYQELSKKYDIDINEFNKSYSLQNTYGFTDKNHAFEAPDTILRIAILGDSYIWGHGLHYTQTWNHLLADKLNLNYTNVEVLHWGRNGWNYHDHYRWVAEEGKKFKVDLVLLGWCDNDLFGEDSDSLRSFQKRYAGPRFFKSFRDYVYREDRVKAYIQSLMAIRDTLAQRNIRFVVFLGGHPPLGLAFEKSILRRQFMHHGIEFYDPTAFLFQRFSNDVNHITPYLDISPANGHSSSIVNFFKADAAYLWLKSQPLFNKARRKQLPNPDVVNKWSAR